MKIWTKICFKPNVRKLGIKSKSENKKQKSHKYSKEPNFLSLK